MDQSSVISVMQMGLVTIIFTAAPPLVLGLAVGLLVSIFQAATSIQEATLAFVPKILAVFIALLVFGNYMLNNLMGLFIELYSNFINYIA